MQHEIYCIWKNTLVGNGVVLFTNSLFYEIPLQGFMQDQIIACHTCFGGHMDGNC